MPNPSGISQRYSKHATGRFLQEDGITRNVLETGEIVTHIQLPENSANFVGSYQKLRLREAWDFPKEGCLSVGFQMMGRINNQYGQHGIREHPRKHMELIETLDKGPNWALEAERLGAELKRAVRPVLNTWFPPAYRKKMALVLARRAMEETSKEITSG